MPHIMRFLGCLAWITVSACGGSSPAGPLVPDGPIDEVQTVIAGRVLDSA